MYISIGNCVTDNISTMYISVTQFPTVIQLHQTEFPNLVHYKKNAFSSLYPNV